MAVQELSNDFSITAAIASSNDHYEIYPLANGDNSTFQITIVGGLINVVVPTSDIQQFSSVNQVTGEGTGYITTSGVLPHRDISFLVKSVRFRAAAGQNPAVVIVNGQLLYEEWFQG